MLLVSGPIFGTGHAFAEEDGLAVPTEEIDSPALQEDIPQDGEVLVPEYSEQPTDDDFAGDLDVKLPEVSYDLEALPFPVRRMHELILEATRAGDIEKLRAYIGRGDNMTLLSFGGLEGDPIEFLKQQSGDENGFEILAILEEVLQAGYVRLEPETEQELYVWPYFFAMPLDRLTERQMVELFRIVTYGDFQDMEDFGGYIFYRVGITPNGRWQFFVAGD
ncbi:MAG: hypothetical protein AAF423_09985 [Pseudomonadota bacterium]